MNGKQLVKSLQEPGLALEDEEKHREAYFRAFFPQVELMTTLDQPSGQGSNQTEPSGWCSSTFREPSPVRSYGIPTTTYTAGSGCVCGK